NRLAQIVPEGISWQNPSFRPIGLRCVGDSLTSADECMASRFQNAFYGLSRSADRTFPSAIIAAKERKQHKRSLCVFLCLFAAMYKVPVEKPMGNAPWAKV